MRLREFVQNEVYQKSDYDVHETKQKTKTKDKVVYNFFFRK